MTDSKSLVYDLLARIGSKPKSTIRDDHRLVQDLRINGDDYGMWLVKELEKRLGIKPSIDEWSRAETVSDILKIVSQHAKPS